MGKVQISTIAFFISLLASLPKIILSSVGNTTRVNAFLSWQDLVLQLFFGFCFGVLVLYFYNYFQLPRWKKAAIFSVSYIVCTVFFVQTHLHLLTLEGQGFSRVSYYIRDLIILTTAIITSNYLKTIRLKKALAIRNQHLETENIKAELNVLRQQLNPHFLFNSLNTLHSLMREDVAKSQFYLENLATLLRFSLDMQNKEVIPLLEEFRLLKAYIYLLSIRFGEKLTIVLPENLDLSVGLIPPMALQLLVENAVKHNEISTKKPLKIVINWAENGTSITVHNNLNPKKQVEETSGLGLFNLQSRYELIDNQSIVIKKETSFFSVTIPILKHESSNP
jgi:two-component system, LytTR family, sensor kinase